MSLKEIRKYVNRPSVISVKFARMVAPFFVKILLYTNITANQVSLFNLFFILIPASLIAFGGYWTVLLGCFLLQMHVILDNVDGTLARIRKTASFFGTYYESLFHDFIPPILILAFSVNSYRFFNNPFFLFLGGITVFFMFFTRQLKVNKDAMVISYLLKNKKRLCMKEGCKKENSKKAKQLLWALNSFSPLVGTFFLLALLNVIRYALIFYSLFYFSIAVAKFYIEIKKGFKEYEFVD